MTLQAELAYARTRVELEPFELASFAALKSFVPNFYKDGRDDTMWGHVLRSLAMEVARNDFQTQYNLYSHDPRFLTPADLIRQYRGPLFINRNYPGVTQYDLDFKDMVLKLLEAYRLGATCTSIQKVIEAYTGEVFAIEEMFKNIGSFYDTSDRHYIRIGVAVAQTQAGVTANVARDVSRVRDLVKDLYGAIDLAKPAHVGIDLTTVLGLDEEKVTPDIEDILRIFMFLEEEEPGDPMLWQAPFLDPNTPDTGVAPIILHFTYQWYRDGQPILGATRQDLVLPNVMLADDGAQIYVKVTEPEIGYVWSPVVTLSVAPTIIYVADDTPAEDLQPNESCQITEPFPGRMDNCVYCRYRDSQGVLFDYVHGINPLPRGKTYLPPVEGPSGTIYLRVPPFSRSVQEHTSVSFSTVAANHVRPGLLSPHLDRVWEIPDGDLLLGIDLE